MSCPFELPRRLKSERDDTVVYSKNKLLCLPFKPCSIGIIDEPILTEPNILSVISPGTGRSRAVKEKLQLGLRGNFLCEIKKLGEVRYRPVLLVRIRGGIYIVDIPAVFEQWIGRLKQRNQRSSAPNNVHI